MRRFAQRPLDRTAAPIWGSWLALTALSIGLAFLEARLNWSGMPIIVGGRPLGFTVYPPVTIAAVLAFALAAARPLGRLSAGGHAPTALAIVPYISKAVNYDTLRDLKPVAQLAYTANAMVVPASFAGSTVKDFIDFAKANPRAVAGFVRATIKGMVDTVKDPGSAIKSVMKRNETGDEKVELDRLNMAIRDNIAPPTLNLDNPSVETSIDLVPHKAKKKEINTVLSNSFGFGGTNASVILRRV